MQIDTYTKAVLTVIAIGVGLFVFDQKPVKDAQAVNATLVGGNYMVATEKTHAVIISGTWPAIKSDTAGRRIHRADGSAQRSASRSEIRGNGPDRNSR